MVSTVLGMTTPTSCYTSNGGTRKEGDDGESVECREVAGHTNRFCMKFKTGSKIVIVRFLKAS